MFELFKSHTARAAKTPAAPNRPPAAKPSGTAPKTAEDLARAERAAAAEKAAEKPAAKVAELGGPEGPEPTRYGDWERKGICYDF